MSLYRCNSIYITLYMSLYICHFTYVTLHMSLYICHFTYVALFNPLLIPSLLPNPLLIPALLPNPLLNLHSYLAHSILTSSYRYTHAIPFHHYLPLIPHSRAYYIDLVEVYSVIITPALTTPLTLPPATPPEL